MNDFEKIPYIVYESAQVKSERVIRRLIIALIMITTMLFVSNSLWIYAWLQYDYTGDSEIITVDGSDGIANYIGNDGDITNGTDYSTQAEQATD